MCLKWKRGALSLNILTTALITFLMAGSGFKTEKANVTFKGTWKFAGGIYNGKPDAAPKTYRMQRKYTDKDFAAYAYEKGYKTEKYETGTYLIKGDTCFETTTFSSRPSQLIGKTVAYIYKLTNKELILSGKLPSGMVVEEHWTKVNTGK